MLYRITVPAQSNGIGGFSMKIARFIAACFLGLTGATLTPQITTTTMLGTVTDKSGAVVVDARVTATNAGTNLQRSVKTNAQGEYRIEFLPVGNYSLAVEAA